ncbi:MAG TPA: serine/threonine-protein kinase [Burkholderiales bacterium]
MSAYHENALRPGARLAEYTIEAVLGRGGFSVTYLARDNALGAYVAIKEYMPEDIAARDRATASVIPQASQEAIRHYHWGLKNFVKEARALARFKHPNIVRVLRFIEANGTAYTVMEYERGQTLAQYLKARGERLDEANLYRIVMPILNGLQAVHEAGMLHLDIKPENIYLREDGTPMLIDFGSARQAMTESRPTGRVTLTHGYAPIEQYPGKGTLGPWSDVYAIGATMYRCVTGKRPEDAPTRYRAMLDYKTDPLRPAVKAGAGRYPALLLQCIDLAMQIHAKDRPQSARALQDYLLGRTRLPGRTQARVVAPAVRARADRRARSRLRRALGRLMRVTAAGVCVAAVAWFGWPHLPEDWRKTAKGFVEQAASIAGSVRPTPAAPAPGGSVSKRSPAR